MHDIPLRIADVILEVEANLRINGKWEKKQPSNSALASSQPFCIDTLKFEQWLQWIFLPRIKQALEKQQPLPKKSGIYQYAEDYLHKGDPGTNTLLALIKRFDDLITLQSSARRH
ncbi:MAG TPA: YqcC family protein [Gammaproteobacteria bacterium]|nr:YqcC family protein [Gammaproteobacteria bacterium]